MVRRITQNGYCDSKARILIIFRKELATETVVLSHRNDTRSPLKIFRATVSAAPHYASHQNITLFGGTVTMASFIATTSPLLPSPGSQLQTLFPPQKFVVPALQSP